jgi:pimeloyl-ACP methyl ester carboxylesterase
MILNDIGAEIEAAGLERIVTGLEKPAVFMSWSEAAEALRRRYAAEFPGLASPRWHAFAKALYRQEAGRILPDYDLNLAYAARSGPRPLAVNVNLWPIFAALQPLPTLVLRGEHSDLLSQTTVARMRALKPDLRAVTVAGRGHVPFLDEPEAVAAIEDFLECVR